MHTYVILLISSLIGVSIHNYTPPPDWNDSTGRPTWNPLRRLLNRVGGDDPDWNSSPPDFSDSATGRPTWGPNRVGGHDPDWNSSPPDFSDSATGRPTWGPNRILNMGQPIVNPLFPLPQFGDYQIQLQPTPRPMGSPFDGRIFNFGQQRFGPTLFV